jgi:cell wall-associated NlpC family hydrolase
MSFAFPRARMGAVALAGLFAGSVLALTPATASAAPQSAALASSSHHHSAHQRKHRIFEKKVHRIMAEAARQKGKPYSYGAAGPHAFDCSGLVMYVFKHAVDKSLPHNAAAQYQVSHHVKRKNLLVGDLIFVDNGGYISHVGIYAGHHHWWVAPHTGERVHKQRIYSAHFKYGRIIRPRAPRK